MAAAEREVDLATERLEHLDELERGAERDRGAGQRGVALGVRRRGALGLEQGERGRGLVGERLGERDLVGRRTRAARG